MPDSNRFEILSYSGVITAITLGLFLSSLYSYLLFHNLIEIVTIAIGFTLFILTWNTRRYVSNNYLRLLGIGYAFIALVDLLHTLAYKGMNVFPGFGANLPTQLWIAARSLQALTLCAAPFLVERKVGDGVIFGGYAAATSVLVAMVYSGLFPDCYIEGMGLTTFKITSEYVITAFLLVSSYLLYRKRKFFDNRVFVLIVSSIACTALSEISFTAYVSVYGFANMVGHFFKLAAFYLIYRAILVTGLQQPFDLIFRDLMRAEEALRKHQGTLEENVRERTAELRASEKRYRGLIQKIQAAVVVHGADTRILTSNLMAQQLLGLTEEQMMGKVAIDPYWHFFREDGTAMPLEEYPVNRVLVTGKPFQNAVVGVHRPGMEDDVWVLVSAAPVFDEKDELIQVIVTFVDITERKKSEEIIALMNFALNNVHESAFLIDENARFHYINDNACRILGYTRDELLVLGIPDIDPDFPMERWSSHWNDLKTQHSLLFEGRHRAKDGRIFPVEVSANYFEYGGRGYNLALVRDITERKRNDAINESRLHLIQFAAEHSSDELLEETLNEAEKLTGSLIGFYHFVEDDQKSLTLQNWSRRTKEEFCRAEGKGLHYPIADAGVWVDCVYQRKPVIHNDYAALPHRKGMPEGHAAVIRELVVPVLRGEKIKAILGVGNKPSDYTGKDVEAISLLADLAWEVVERKLADEAVHRLNRELKAMSNCNQTLLRATDEQTLLNEICRIVCDEAGYRMAWVGYAEHDDVMTVHPVAWAGVEDGHLATPDITWADTERGHGPTGTAIRSGAAACIQDFMTDAQAAPWRENALQRGYRSSIALPLKDENSVTFGALNIYSTEPNAFTPDEIRLMEELGGDLAFGINVLRARLERKRSEDLLHRREEEFRTLAENLPDQVIRYDLAGRVQYMNPRVAKDYGATPDQVIGKTLLELRVSGSATEAKSFHDVVMQAVRQGTPNALETSWITHNGKHSFEVRHIPEKDEGGRVTSVLGIARDITDRKQAEEEIRKLNEDLEQRVRDRTAQLEAANKELEAFAYSVSHDLRAPLRHIDGFVELLQKRTGTMLDEQSRHYLTTISNSAKRMGGLIGDLLSFSRMGRQELSLQRVNLEVLVQEVIREHEPETQGRSIRWNIAELPEVTGDRAMLRIVMVNLISNALKFTRPREQAEIEIGCRIEETQTTVFIRDNGVGFDMDYVDRLFGVFQRLHRADEFEGTGIGLANVRRIIHRHGGRTWAEGKMDQGAVFYFSLPQSSQGR